MGLYLRIAALLPDNIQKKIEQEMIYIGESHENAQKFMGFMLVFGLVFSLVIAAILQIILNWFFLITFPILLVSIGVGTYYWLNSIAEKKGEFVENILPDALQLVSSNIKAGLTTERALFMSARPEFKYLSVELKAASKRIIAGQGLADALTQLPAKIKSLILKRTMWLIVQGIKSGAQLADLLNNLSADLREDNELRHEIHANVSLYVLMIFFAAAIGAPALLGLSTIIVESITEQTQDISLPQDFTSRASGSAIGVTGLVGTPASAIEPAFILFFAQIALIVTVIFSSLVLGVINSGKELDGVKYIPVMLVIAFVVFFGIRLLMGQALGGVASGLL